MTSLISLIIQAIFQVVFWVVFIDIILSWFMSPSNPIRSALDRIVNPMLAPIRKIIPSVAGFDFSPMILLILLQVVEYLVLRLI
jgi:YggT family protein